MLNLKQKFNKNFFLLLCIDTALFTASYIGAYFLRFDLSLPREQYLQFRNTLIPIILSKFFIFYYFNLYRGMWRYTGLKDLANVTKASLVSSVFIATLVFICTGFRGFARSIFIIDGILTIFLIGGVRLSIRLIFSYLKKEALPWQKNGINRINGSNGGNGGNGSSGKRRKKVLIVGAGDVGEKILREINDNKDLVHYEVAGFLDDDPKKIHCHIHGIKVLADIRSVASVAQSMDLDEIIIAIPSASAEEMRRIIDLCQKTGVTCKTIPGLGELMNGQVNIATIRDVSYADLLGRSQIELDMEKIGAYLAGKRVLITGAGGSIGSEFCRQVAQFEPEVLIMLDRAESSLYDIEMELKRLYPQQRIVPILSSVTSQDRFRRVFHQFKPQVVFHAAAYKHVPMMEMHPWEAVYNNILGTKNVLEMAIETGAERFVLVSTDKAVRPTNIMGASKRVAEIIMQLKYNEMQLKYKEAKLQGTAMPAKVQTKIIAVRFGNVIGSAGSVIPLFKKQIAGGGPVTVTHAEVTRYFMTINEAVQLVLQAGAMGESGEIYILKMGRPVKILDMARDLIRLSGFDPDKDIPIKITGLRPGEKLYEELITEGEGIVPTAHDKLMVLRRNGNGNGHGNGHGNGNGNGNGYEHEHKHGNGHGNGNGEMTYRDLEKKIEELLVLAQNHDNQKIQSKLAEIVPEYRPQRSVEREQFVCEKIADLEDAKTYDKDTKRHYEDIKIYDIKGIQPVGNA